MRLHLIPTTQFKTYTIVIQVETPLAEQTVTPTALLPFVLKRGTERIPETAKLRQKLDELFGAGFGADVVKRGERQNVQLSMDIANAQYLSDTTPLLEEGIQLLSDVLLRPAREGESFVKQYVESEKEVMRKRIESLIDDKIRYAAERCIQEMCANESFRLFQYGQVNELEQIDAESLYAFYLSWLSRASIDFYIVGNTTENEIQSLVQKHFHFDGKQNNSPSNPKPNERPVKEVKKITERLDVNQGKLNMGLRTHTTYADDDYAAMLMYNGVLGGFPHSKLFVNVREKASLAYYAVSRLDGHKGIQTIQSGIQIENYDKAVDIIQKQLEALKQGDISDVEFNQTRAVISNQLREVKDMPFERINVDYHSVLSGRNRSLDDLLREVSQVTKEDIQRAAQKVELDTIYFLTDKKGGAQ